MSVDARFPQQSDERYVDDIYRHRPALSPDNLHRPLPSARSDVAHHREPFTERQARSWDRDQELHRDHYSPVLARGVHPDRTEMFEVNSRSFSGQEHEPSVPPSSKRIRIHPGSSSQSHPDDFSLRLEVPGEHWPLDGHVVERTRDERAVRTHSHHQRPTPSRRGGSLLDRLSLDDGSSGMSLPSLRDRVQVIPSKRDREEMVGNDAVGGDIDVDEGGPDDSASRKPRRRMKMKRGRRSGAQ
jgi:hypothetical protein